MEQPPSGKGTLGGLRRTLRGQAAAAASGTLGRCGLERGASPPHPRQEVAGRGRRGPRLTAEHFLIGPTLPRRREEGRTGGPAQGRTRHCPPERSISRRPGRGGPGPAQPSPGPFALRLLLLLSREAAGRSSERSQLPLQSPFFPSACLARASLALKAVNVWSHSSPFSLAALPVSRSKPDQ